MKPLRFHMLKATARAAKLGKFVLGGGEADEETPSMEKGTALHALVFETQPVTFYPKARNEKHKEYQAFQADHEGSKILTPAEYDEANGMADAVRGDRDAMDVLKGCAYEQTLLFDWLGRRCRSTPDARCRSHVSELKSSKTAQPDEFFRIVLKSHYHTQMAMQQTGIEAALGYFPGSAFIVAVEPKPPYLVSVLDLGPRMMDQAHRTLRLWMERFLGCERAGEWPGYSQSIVKVDLPEEDSVFEEEAA